MTISAKDLRILYQRSGNRCAFPGCGKLLTHTSQDFESDECVHVAISEIAHIVGQKMDGPRGHDRLPLEARDGYENLIVLCEEHHRIVDVLPAKYSVERLQAFKSEHETRVQQATALLEEGSISLPEAPKCPETLYSTLLPVLQMPRYVYGVPVLANFKETDVTQLIAFPTDGTACPFIVRANTLYCFNDLEWRGNPFRDVPKCGPVEITLSTSWWTDPVRSPWYAQLLGRCLNKLTGRKGLKLDKAHHRYFFEPEQDGVPLSIEYRPLNMAKTSRFTVWQPTTKATGEKKPFWYHLAVDLRFHRVSDLDWVLSIRPELRVTKDGRIPLESDRIGSKVTRKKSRMFNIDVLEEINFWRDYLCDSKPRIVLKFGRRQHLVISSTILSGEVVWPGMPAEHRKKFANVSYEEDLFTWADRQELEGANIDEDEAEEAASSEYADQDF